MYNNISADDDTWVDKKEEHAFTLVQQKKLTSAQHIEGENIFTRYLSMLMIDVVDTKRGS